MRKLTLLFLCLLGLGISYAEEVNIGLQGQDEEENGLDVMLSFIPGYFFLDNNPVIYNEGIHYQSTDVVIYDYNFNPSTIHFNCKEFDQHIRIVDTRFESYDSNFVPITQCFFNNDALYEGITFDVETKIDEWGYESYSYSNYRVVNQNGDVLYSFETPEGYKDGGSPCFYKVSDDIIIAENNYYEKIDGENLECMCWYTLKVGQTGSLAPIQQMREMKLEANPVAKGDDLVVTVGADSPQSSIMVTSLSGRTIKEVPVIEGKAVISTSDLSSGLYIASQKEGASAKFIVK